MMLPSTKLTPGASEVFSTFEVKVAKLDCSGSEPIIRGEYCASHVCSEAHGATFGQSPALGFPKPDLSTARGFTIEINSIRRSVLRVDGPAVDTQDARMSV